MKLRMNLISLKLNKNRKTQGDLFMEITKENRAQIINRVRKQIKNLMDEYIREMCTPSDNLLFICDDLSDAVDNLK